jgi:hypothetical protein
VPVSNFTQAVKFSDMRGARISIGIHNFVMENRAPPKRVRRSLLTKFGYFGPVA